MKTTKDEGHGTNNLRTNMQKWSHILYSNTHT